MDQWLLVVISDTAAKGSAKELELPVLVRFTAHFLLIAPFFSYHNLCSSEHCFSFSKVCLLLNTSQASTAIGRNNKYKIKK